MPERRERVLNAERAANRACRPVEDREEAVSGRVDLLACEAVELPPHDRVVLLDEPRPRRVAERPGRLRRADDVREEDRREDAIGDRRRPGAREELLDLVEQPVDAGPGQRAPSRQLDQAGRGNALCQVACHSDVVHRIVRAVQDDRGRLDGGQHVSDVGGRHSRDDVSDRSGTAREPLARSPPRLHHVVGVRPEAQDARPVSPTLDDVVDDRVAPLLGQSRYPGDCVGPEQGESARALGVRGREQHGHRAALVVPEHGGAFGADCVHDGADVVHPRLEVVDSAVAVGEPRASLVEADEPRERRQPLEEGGVPRLFPVELEVAGKPGHEDEVERPVACDLVRDRDIAALRVANRASHATIVAQVSPRAEASRRRPLAPAVFESEGRASGRSGSDGPRRSPRS